MGSLLELIGCPLYCELSVSLQQANNMNHDQTTKGREFPRPDLGSIKASPQF